MQTVMEVAMSHNTCKDWNFVTMDSDSSYQIVSSSKLDKYLNDSAFEEKYKKINSSQVQCLMETLLERVCEFLDIFQSKKWFANSVHVLQALYDLNKTQDGKYKDKAFAEALLNLLMNNYFEHSDAHWTIERIESTFCRDGHECFKKLNLHKLSGISVEQFRKYAKLIVQDVLKNVISQIFLSKHYKNAVKNEEYHSDKRLRYVSCVKQSKPATYNNVVQITKKTSVAKKNESSIAVSFGKKT